MSSVFKVKYALNILLQLLHTGLVFLVHLIAELCDVHLQNDVLAPRKLDTFQQSCQIKMSPSKDYSGVLESVQGTIAKDSAVL